MLYTMLKFLHVFTITVWVGGLIMLLILNRLLTAAGDRNSAQALGRLGAVLGVRLFLPAVLLTALTGIGMVQDHELSWGTAWIVWGIVGLLASWIIGAVFTGGAARKLAAAVARGEIDAAGIARVQRRMLVFAVVNVVLLISVIFAMVVKPA
jgi:uncharacterized membrane protein